MDCSPLPPVRAQYSRQLSLISSSSLHGTSRTVYMLHKVPTPQRFTQQTHVNDAINFNLGPLTRTIQLMLPVFDQNWYFFKQLKSMRVSRIFNRKELQNISAIIKNLWRVSSWELNCIWTQTGYGTKCEDKLPCRIRKRRKYVSSINPILVRALSCNTMWFSQTQ